MGSSTTIKRYNDLWLELFDKFLEEEHTPREFTCTSEKSAEAMRLEFYKVRRVILGDNRPGGPENPELAERYAYVLNSREVKVRGNKLIFDHKDHNWIGKILSQVVGTKFEPVQGEPFTPQSERLVKPNPKTKVAAKPKRGNNGRFAKAAG